MHAGVDQHDAVAGRDRPGVAVRDPRPGQRQAQPPQAREHPLAAAELSSRVPSAMAPHDIVSPRRLRPSDGHTAEIAKRYFEALAAHDLDAAVRLLGPGRRSIGSSATQELIAPDGIRAYFGELFAAFPDFRFEILELTTARSGPPCAGGPRRRSPGPGSFQGFAPNGAGSTLEGCDVVTVAGRADRPQRRLPRQRRRRPPARAAAADRLARRGRLTRLANLRTRAAVGLHGGDAERIADGVWVVRGGFPLRTMNVYLIEDRGRRDRVRRRDRGDGAGDRSRRRAAGRDQAGRARPRRRRSPRRRARAGRARCTATRRARPRPSPTATFATTGTSPSSGPTPARSTPGRCRPGTAARCTVAGTVDEGDEVAGFRVIELPGHAPGLIGLFRESDRLALVSDCFYTLDPRPGARAPRGSRTRRSTSTPSRRARSIRKLAELEPVGGVGRATPIR